MKSIARSIILILLIGVTNAVYSQDLASILNSAPNQEATWSVTVRDAEGNILEGWNTDKLIIPASNQKLFTTAAVLDGLGSDFEYHTMIYRTGEITDSVLYGDLIIRGVGDPTISGILYEDDREYVLKSLNKQIKASGIKEISGKLIANDSYFDSMIYPKGWDWDDLAFYYGVEIAPLSFNNNAVDLVVTANGEVGERPSIQWFPYNTDYVTFENEQQIDSPSSEYDEDYRKELGTNNFYLGSSLPKGYLEEESLAITDASLYFLDSFQKFLNRNGIITDGELEKQNVNINDYWSTYPIVAVHTSQPLGELIEWTNKESDNFYTEMILKTLAAEVAGIPGTFENGIKEVRNFLGGLGIDTTYVIMKDGSGMASGNFTTTGILSEFLAKMRGHKDFNSFYRSMSVAGIDGTIAYRMKGTSLYNNFKGKSGYVGGVRTLSGYMTTSSGEQIIVSMSANNFIGKVRSIDAVHEQILYYLYEKY